MKVTLIAHTPLPAHLMIFTKNTRLKMSADQMDNILMMNDEQVKRELDYMVNTIKSSWEFVDMTFMIEGVSRAFTHQFVRNRQGSYAQQTMRILDMNGFDFVTGPSIENNPEAKELYEDFMVECDYVYNKLIELGANIEDARGVLPTNICTNIVAKFNLRTLSDMMASRASSRTQGEYREVIQKMYDAVVEQMPWAADFLRDHKSYALSKLESVIRDQFDGTDKLTDIIKLIDIVRNAK